MRAVFGAWVWLCLTPATVRPPPYPHPARASRIPSEAEALRFFEGDWRCEAQGAPAGPGAAPSDNKVRLTLVATLERNWIMVTRLEGKAGGTSAARQTQAFWGYDRSMGQYLGMGVGDRGDHYTMTSGGLSGDVFIWAGTQQAADGHKVLFRSVMTKLSPQCFAERTEVNTYNAWRPLGPTLICKRAPITARGAKRG